MLRKSMRCLSFGVDLRACPSEPGEHMKASSRPNRVWKFVLGFGAVVGLVYTGTQLQDWWNRPQVKLVGTVETGPIVVTAQTQERVNLLASLTDEKWMADLEAKISALPADITAKQTEVVLNEHQRVLGLMRRAINNAIPHNLTDLDRDAKSYSLVTIENKGTQPASAIRLMVPDSNLLAMTRDDGSYEVINKKSASLDSLYPGETAVFFAFHRESVAARFEPEIRLTHSNGVGAIHVIAKVGALGQFIDAWFLPGLVMMVPLLLLAILFANSMGFRILRLRPGQSWAIFPTGFKVVHPDALTKRSEMEKEHK
jgi:hypothetical protein